MILGLTGSYGSGKSTVAAMFESLGAVVIDADALAREVVLPGRPAYEEIRREFGPAVLQPDGQLDRKALAQRVFSSDTDRRRLEAIIHPRVRERELALIQQHKHHPLVVLNVPLLFENRLDSLCDATCVVTVSEPEREKRLRIRDNASPEDIQRRLESQLPQHEKIRRADYIIDNSGPLPNTRGQVETLLKTILKK